MSLYLRLIPCLAVSLALGACTADSSPDAAESSNDALISDVASMTQNPDGSFEVKCKDGHQERSTSEAILADEVCKPTSLDVFDVTSCAGDPLSEKVALRYFSDDGPATIGHYSVSARTRACSADGCGAWEPALHLPFTSGHVPGTNQTDYYPIDRAGDVVLSFVNGGRANHQAVQLALHPATQTTPSGTTSLETLLATGELVDLPSSYGFNARFVPSSSNASRVTWFDNVYAGRGRAYSIPSTGGQSDNFASPMTLDARVTDHCIRIAETGRDVDRESQVVFYASFARP